MKTTFLKTSVIVAASALAFSAGAINPSNPEKTAIVFKENKGQVHDQNFNARPDVLFSGKTNGMVYHLTNTGISYQLYKTESLKADKFGKKGVQATVIDKQTIYRVDINWLNVNANAFIQKGEMLDGIDNYYNSSCPNGALNVRSYKDITYKGIYSNIDLKWYESNGELEYDFIVNPGADFSAIQFEIKGAEDISVNNLGELEIVTPLGTIKEKAPVAFQGSKTIKANWKITGNKIGFDLGSYNKSLPLIIDPVVRVWGTYYGGNLQENGTDVETDASNNVIMCGNTESAAAIATAGAHQVTYAGNIDAFVAKFNASGVRQWATYYGGSGTDYGSALAISSTGDVYMAGTSNSTVGISTAGSHQVTRGGGNDAYLVKFNSSGVRQWATYYGDAGSDGGFGCALDATGNVYLSGQAATSTGTVFATVGSHQATHAGGNDAFLVKFNSSGVRQWGTYYGGTGNEIGYGAYVDGSNNIIMSGITSSTGGTSIATVGSHQSAYGGGVYDAYVVKFNSSGVRQWGTYYGGAGEDWSFNTATDNSGNVVISGKTTSSVSIATAGAWDVTANGGSDAGFIAKFSSTGVRAWGTYLGTTVNGADVKTNPTTGAVYTTGGTFGGTADAVLYKFSSAGVFEWNTVVSGTNGEDGSGVALDNASAVYMCGSTNSPITTNIGTTGSHQSAPGSNGTTGDAHLQKYFDCVTIPLTITGTSSVCTGQSTALTLSGTAGITSYSWSTGATNVTTVSVSPGTTTTYTVSANTATAQCVYSTSFTVNVVGLPSVTANAPTICQGNSATLIATGAASGYSWTPGSLTGSTVVVTPTATTVYTLTTANSLGCTNSRTTTVTVNTVPSVTLSASSNSVCSGTTVSLTASGATTYTWNTGATTSSINVTPSVNTNYTVTGANGTCTNTKTISISVTASPTVNLTASSTTLCTGSTVNLNATGATSYSWNTGATTATIAVSPSVTTSYSVTGTNGVCSQTKTITITNNTPSVAVSASSNTICAGGNSTLTASGANTYTWNPGSLTGSVIVVSPTVTTTYFVQGVSNGCFEVKTTTVVVSSTIAITATPSSTISCSGAPVTITANGASTYTWNTGSNSNTIVVTPSVNTTYTVSGNSATCFGTKTITIFTGTNPNVNVFTTNSVTCANAIPQSATLTATGAQTYSWSSGATTPVTSVSPSVTTTYSVTGTNFLGCKTTTMITVTVNPLPTVNVITSNPVICSLPNQQTATLTASGASTYSWNTGATTAVVAVSPGTTTTYTVVGTDAFGCSNSSVFTQSVSLCTGIETQTINNEFTVYPNPSNGSFTIRTSVGGEFELFNQLGQTVLKFENEKGVEEMIQVNNLSEGVYYLHSKTEKIYKKIVVTK